MREAVGQRADAVERRADLLAQHDPAVRVEPAVGDEVAEFRGRPPAARSTVTASLWAMRNSHGRTTISRSRRRRATSAFVIVVCTASRASSSWRTIERQYASRRGA